jgi:hypothetical protein
MMLTGLCTNFKIVAFLLDSFTKFTYWSFISNYKRVIACMTTTCCERARSWRDRSSRSNLSWSSVKSIDTMIWLNKLMLIWFWYSRPLKCRIYHCLSTNISFGLSCSFTRSWDVSTRFSRCCCCVCWLVVRSWHIWG